MYHDYQRAFEALTEQETIVFIRRDQAKEFSSGLRQVGMRTTASPLPEDGLGNRMYMPSVVALKIARDTFGGRSPIGLSTLTDHIASLGFYAVIISTWGRNPTVVRIELNTYGEPVVLRMTQPEMMLPVALPISMPEILDMRNQIMHRIMVMFRDLDLSSVAEQRYKRFQLNKTIQG